MTPTKNGSANDKLETSAITLVFCNQKGGVGKTTTAVNVGACLAETGSRVLLVDLDPQGNASTGVGIGRDDVRAGSYEALGGAEPVDAIVHSVVDGLDVIPSTIDLAGAEVELVAAAGREQKLYKALAKVSSTYDYILVDSPPSLGLLTVNALVAADAVVIPIQCEYYALEGLGQLLRTVEMIRDGVNHRLEVGGVVLTMYDARTKLSRAVAHDVRKHLGKLVFRTAIPRTVRLSEAPSFGKPIIQLDPTSRGAVTYKALASEIRQRWPRKAAARRVIRLPEPVGART